MPAHVGSWKLGITLTCTVTCRDAATGAAVELAVTCEPDVPGARRWLGSYRRIHSVAIMPQGSSWRSVVHGIGHRRPSVRTVPLRVGLGLGSLGVPLVVKQGER